MKYCIDNIFEVKDNKHYLKNLERLILGISDKTANQFKSTRNELKSKTDKGVIDEKDQRFLQKALQLF